jgi:hypothetical protein
MITRFRRNVLLAVAGTLTAGGLTAGVLTMAGNASPETAGNYCQVAAGSSGPCYLAESVQRPLSIVVSVTSQPAESATVSWTVSCLRNGNAISVSGTRTGTTPFQAKLSAPRGNAADCSLTSNVTGSGQGSLRAGYLYTLGHPIMIDIPQGANYSGQPIYALRCLTDPGNNPANRVPVQIRGCEVLYSQSWTFSNGEIMHGRYCMTDKGDGGSGSKVILYTCSHAADQVWTYRARGPEGQYVLKAHGGTLCLTDPRTSTANGTQLIVSGCAGGNSQKWYSN